MDMKQVFDLAAAYSAAGLADTWAGGFLNSISENETLPRGRGLSILDDLLKKGPPESWPNWSLFVEARFCFEKLTGEKLETLQSIVKNIKNGYAISDKQIALARKIIDTADIPTQYYALSKSDCEWIDGIFESFRFKNHYYWQHRASTYNRLSQIFNKHFNVKSDTLEIDSENWGFLNSVYKKQMEAWNLANEIAGTLQNHDGKICLVLEDRFIDNLGVFVNVLKDGDVVKVKIDSLKPAVKPPRKKKAKKSV